MKILILEGLHGNNKGKKCQWRLKQTNLKVGDTVVLNCHDWKIIKVIKPGAKKFLGINLNMFPKGTVISEYSTGFGNNEFYKYIERMKFKDMNFNDMCEREHLKMFKKLVNDPLIKKIIKKCHKFANIGKEVKKVRPYFETKVVKVKKKKTYSNHIIIDGKKYILYEDKKENVYPHKKKGNWVNNENLEKIKFPCFCSYRSHSGKKHYAQLIKNKDNGKYKYELLRISQDNGESIFLSSGSLRKLIRKWDIHILKGKIIIFEEK